ncbi:MAG: hypothetical protein ABS76_07540 [Pelagibacterium sp. SCN 64-44]|nr:MAG: hypothetical protein ABS76_07540 [Pelagibacterium sp. SCN 64-44]
MPEDPEPSHSPFATPRYKYYFAGRILASMGLTATAMIAALEVYDISRLTMSVREAALQLGLFGLTQFVPVVAMTPISGVAVDIYNRGLIVRLSILAELICVLALAITAWLDATTVFLLFVYIFIFGVAKTFLFPAMNAIVPSLVPREAFPNAIAVNAVAARAGGILGPVIGGFTYAISSVLSYGLSAGLLIAALVSMIMLGSIRPTERGTPRAPLGMIADGFRYLLSNRLLYGVVSLDLFAVLLGGSTALLPVFARDVLHVGAAELGYLRAAPGVGALAMAIWLSLRPPGTNMGRNMLLGVVVFGLATIGFGLSKALPVSLFLLMILGMADIVSKVVRQSIVQLNTEDQMRGRMGAISTLTVSTSNELGDAASGFLAAFVGPVAAVVAGGAGSITIAAIWARAFPELYRKPPR